MCSVTTNGLHSSCCVGMPVASTRCATHSALLLSLQSECMRRLFPLFAQVPILVDMVLIHKGEGDSMHVRVGGAGKIGGIHEVEIDRLGRGLRYFGAHAWLIAHGTIVRQHQASPV